MKILITGKTGQLGSELQDLHTFFENHQVKFVDRQEMDLSNPLQIERVLNAFVPNLIINTGAFTAVDLAEKEMNLCDVINHKAVATIAHWAAVHNAKVIHISTDYVFDGTSEISLKEIDKTNPINVYGSTKWLGEQALIHSGAPYVIIRTSWVYSVYGANFVKTMLRLMNERSEINVVNDQIGSPTYARDLAQVILKISNANEFVSGIYHYSNDGKISWYDFALAIKNLKQLNCKVNPIPSNQFPTPAKRPHYSLLDKDKIKSIYHISVPEWEQSLQQMLELIK